MSFIQVSWLTVHAKQEHFNTVEKWSGYMVLAIEKVSYKQVTEVFCQLHFFECEVSENSWY